jgi:hypothetical protein
VARITAFETSGRGFTERELRTLQDLFEVAGIAVVDGKVKLRVGG